MKRVVLDTNVLVSASIFGGLPKTLVDLAQAGQFTLLTSLEVIDEFEETLTGRKFKVPLAKMQALRQNIEECAEVISTHLRIQAVAADPDDDRVLECAIAGQANAIVSGDRHLLQLGSYQQIPVLTVRQFLDTLSPAS